MNIDSIKERLVKNIDKVHDVWFFTVTKNELRIRCPYCGDSQKNSKHAHLYLQMDDDSIIKYYCQRCNIGGIVDSDFLKDIGLSDYELFKSIDELTKEYSKNNKTHKSSNNRFTNQIFKKYKKSDDEIIIPEFNGKKSSINKLNYINSRYSFDLEPEEYIEKYKVVFSIGDFIVANNINLSLDIEDIKYLNKQFVGFLSADKSYIIFRNIDRADKQRYYNLNLFNDSNAKKFYIPTSQVDLFSLNTELILTEGIFDIIGVKEYFYKDNLNDKIFCAVSGKGYNFIINSIARLGLINLKIKIYSDQDVNINYYKYLKRNNPILRNNEVRIYYNRLEKDYGIPKQQIQLKSTII